MQSLHNRQQNLRPVNTTDFLSARARNYGYYPLIKGNTIPDFYLPAESRVTKKQVSTPVADTIYFSAEDFLNHQQPLVITFFGMASNNAEFMKNLESLQADVQVMGGKLLVLTSLQPQRLKKVLRNRDELTIFYDKDNAVAELFGLYDAANPLWQWVAGVEDDAVALPAFYIISANREIVYHHIDYTLSTYTDNNYNGQPFTRDLLTNVYNAARQITYQPLQYKSVS